MQDVNLNPTLLQGLTILLIIAIAFSVTKAGTVILERLADRFPARRLFFKRLQPFYQITGYGIPAYLIIRIISPDQNSLLAMLYAMGFAIGLAAQDLLKDLIGGFVVLMDTSFQVGDRIRVNDSYGEVTKIGLRSIKLMALDNELITIPNSQLLQTEVANTNVGTVDAPVTTHIYLPQGSDVQRIEKIVREAVLTSKAICRTKPISVVVKDTNGDGEILTDMEIRAYVFDVRFAEIFLTDITRRIKTAIFNQGLIIDEAERIDNRVDVGLGDTLIALSQRFANSYPMLAEHNGHTEDRINPAR